MATVTGLTAARMEAIEAASVVGGTVNGGGHLILTKHDASTIDAGSVIGPTGAPGISVGTFDAAMLEHLPPGSISDYIGTTAPSGGKWLLMNGQTVASAQSLYPDLWAKLPAAMKSGTSMLMPDTRGKFFVGYHSGNAKFDAIGETGGAETVALSQAELPNAVVSINPPALTISVDPPSTTISVDPPNTAFSGTTNSAGTHTHQITAGSALYIITDGSPDGFPGAGLSATGSGYVKRNLNTSGNSILIAADGAHAHTVSGNVDIAAFSATVDIAPFNATVDIPAFNSAALGSGDGHNNLPPYITFQKIIKVL